MCVAKSTLPGAGYGLFSEKKLGAGRPLYEYTGRSVTHEQADKYPNAYMFNSELSEVLDASQDICSPAKFVNTKGQTKCQNNCEFVTHEKRIFLSTTRAIGKGEELFAPYGKDTPKWPMTFLGDAQKKKFDFMRYSEFLSILFVVFLRFC